MTQETTNPAKRVLDILMRLQSAETPSRPSACVWATAFGIAATNCKALTVDEVIKLHVCLSELQREIIELELQIKKRVPDDPNFFLQKLDTLRVLIGRIDLSQPFSNQPKIENDQITVLKSLTYFMDKEPETPVEEITKLMNAVHRLIKSVHDGDFDEDFRKWMLTVLNEALLKLELYRIHGPIVFRSVYASLTGEMSVHSQELKRTFDRDENGKTFIAHLLGFWGGVRRYANATAGNAKFLLGMAKIASSAADTPTDSFDGAIEHLTGEVLENIENLPSGEE